MAIMGCNSLRACFLTSMEQERFFNSSIFFHERFYIRFSYLLSVITTGDFHPVRCGFLFHQ